MIFDGGGVNLGAGRYFFGSLRARLRVFGKFFEEGLKDVLAAEGGEPFRGDGRFAMAEAGDAAGEAGGVVGVVPKADGVGDDVDVFEGGVGLAKGAASPTMLGKKQ